jgi:hypothetical protein
MAAKAKKRATKKTTRTRARTARKSPDTPAKPEILVDRGILQAKFLAAYRECGIVRRAARAAGISRTTHYGWLEEDDTYPDRFREAHEDATDILEEEARRRAIEGLRRVKFNPKTGKPYIDPETKQPYTEHEYSDRILEVMLKAKRPEEFKERIAAEHTGKNGGPIETKDASELTDAERAARVAALFDLARARRDGRAPDSAGEMGTVPGSSDAGVRK